ncbi:MAG: DNA methyltransferase [Bacteroidota bacterium]
MKLLEVLESRLKENPGFITENGELKKWVIISQAQNLNENLLALLMGDENLRSAFFTNIAGALVFEQKQFINFLEQKNYLNDSYTQYKNKIGLTINGKYIRQQNDVALVWPYKDCVLEGGQSREEQSREEIFFNETLARDEITQLLEPKVLTGAIRYTIDGGKALKEFNRNGEGRISDNLIVKGNNLLALHSLEKEFRGRVKLVYIDPPYNTGKDSFQYNDRFNESSWLTFMKNRLTVARDLLATNGVIFIQCDDNEQAYLKILLDEIFGPKNFVETFIWKNTDNAPVLSKKTRRNIEFIHCYEKTIDNSRAYTGRESENDNAPLLNSGNPLTELEFKAGIIEFRIPDGFYPKGNYDRTDLLSDLVVENGRNKNAVRLRGNFKWQQSFLQGEIDRGTYFIIKTKKFSIRYQRQFASVMPPDKLIDHVYLSKAIGIESNEDSKKHIDALGLKFNSYPKPESLIAFLIKMVTDEGDIVLDYHLGSGTTASTAHKMKRQYIGIEQMDYIRDVTVERLKKVIAGEQGGASKSMAWQGGGEFVYFELKKYNEEFIERIRDAAGTLDLLRIWEDIKKHSFLDYNVDIRKQDENITAFTELEMKEQKQHLLEILDKNQLYVNLSSLKDADFACTEEEKRVTHSFYQLK